MTNHVVVKALVNLKSKSEEIAGNTEIEVKRGDIGHIRWLITENADFPETRIVWDADSARIPRLCCLREVEVVGIESGGSRVVV